MMTDIMPRLYREEAAKKLWEVVTQQHGRVVLRPYHSDEMWVVTGPDPDCVPNEGPVWDWLIDDETGKRRFGKLGPLEIAIIDTAYFIEYRIASEDPPGWAEWSCCYATEKALNTSDKVLLLVCKELMDNSTAMAGDGEWQWTNMSKTAVDAIKEWVKQREAAKTE